MDGETIHHRKAQLDKEEREHLEDVVTEMRDRVEANVRYQLEDAGQTQISDGGVSERQRLLSELAADVDDYKQLATDISEACDEVAADIPSNWSDRALSEITTAGYQPNPKHGVAINITPLAEKSIVPEIVEEKVL
ncbi:hypothetical protein [Haladaptatus sp. DYF46]|uniref:hypothetical protein n=1 Tax=Haladaptatus sp. DYF46 TaxID=2886041 RepID=UPI001E5D9288|nr:hypothetical protein [Haladaptatus sp. DYF46]